MSHSRTCLLVCALALYATPTFAGTLAGDVNSYLGIWHGTTNFQGYDLSNQPTDFYGYVEWAVYAPGQFPGGFSGYTPDPNEFVYAYQAFVTGPAPLSSTSINLTNVAGNIGTFQGNGVFGDAPVASFLLPFDSANWAFDGVLQGGSSMGLAFSSPNIPMLSSGTTIDHGSFAYVIPVPSPDSIPVPEPATITMGLLGMIGFAFAMLRRRARRLCA